MKNREYKALLALALMASLVMGSVKGSTLCAQAADRTNAASSQTEGSGEAKAKKEETVYVKTDASGAVKKVTVSDQLKNITDLTQIEDVSELAGIENVKGDETFEEKDGGLVWDGEQKEICYQGTTTKELPVQVDISYRLDGKEMTAEELAGKSGHLEIRYTYKNGTAAQGGYTPFLMATGLILDTEKFANVTVDHGKIVSDGDRDIVIGMGVPQMKETLGTEDLDIPEGFTVEADVTDYETVQGMTVATNSVFNELSTDQFDSLEDLEGSMGELQSASRQLVSGSGELKSGLDTLLAASGTLTGGIDALAAGGNTLMAGAGTLQNGANALDAGLGTASAKVNQTLLPGVRQLDAGVGQMEESLNAALPTLANGVSGLNQAMNTGNASAGTPSLVSAAGALKDGAEQASAGAAALSGALTQVGTGVSALNSGIGAVAEQTGALKEGAAALYGVLSQMSGSQQAAVSGEAEVTNAAGAASGTASVTYDGNAQNAGAIASLQAALGDENLSDAARENINAALSQLQTTQTVSGAATMEDAVIASGTATVNTTVSVQNPNVTQALGIAAQVKDGTAAVDDAMNREGGIAGSAAYLNAAVQGNGTAEQPGLAAAAEALRAGNADLASGAAALKGGIDQVAAGAGALDAGVNGAGGLTEQVQGGVSQLKTGTGQLLSGVDGEEGLAAGLQKLAGGAAQIAAGSEELHTGAGTLSGGIGTLQSGSGELVGGVQKLADGAGELNDGMIRFDAEGIEKLVGAFDGDIGGLLGKLNEMLDASRSYKNFSGISDGMDGEVKFIFVTDK